MRFLKSCYYGIHDTVAHDGIEHAGYMAFLSLLSLFPFLVFIMSVTSFVDELALAHQIFNFISNNLPDNFYGIIKHRVKEIENGPPPQLLTISIISAIWTASASVEGLRTALNRAYRVNSPPTYIWRRLLSIGQFILISIILLFFMLIIIVVPPLLNSVPGINKVVAWIFDFSIWQKIGIFLSFTLIVTSLYQLITNQTLRYAKIIPGAMLVTVLWMLLGNALSIYFQSFEQITLIYGSIKSVIYSLLFFYLVHLILIFGAEFNYHWSKQSNNR